MIGSLGNVLLREIPGDLLAGVAAGDFRVCGSIVQSVSSGRIVGHLQETSALTSLLSSGPLDPLQLAAQTVAVVQNEQIKAAVAAVHSLQLANLALSGVAIGVSIAGTALLASRIARVEDKVDATIAGVAVLAQGVENLRRDRIAEDFTRLRTLADQVDEAWLPSASRGEWIEIAREAHFLSDSFDRRARELTVESDRLAAEPFVEAFALASALRVTARLGAGQDDMALKAAAARTGALASLGEPLQLAPLVLAGMANRADAGTPGWQEGLEARSAELKATVAGVRDRELAAAATVQTLEELQHQGITGRDWLEASHSEDRSPLLFLPVESSRASSQRQG